ncbi:phage major capsid protein [Rhodococcus hoagii]|uniref:Phage major capsid protein n=1 Tax=Rhodococcus hoagii TaxID=43767 RepID=A0A9Q2PD27_RHOHA|nr:phage major capsid protein [Prescottella equi]MBM4567981.1 phage major capsid protein [Prescottella equi]NKS54720.1 phage major capsid protein [Prescottella equi]NKT69663.1 phage major capsid protein [Prescottella equi]NKU73409.1 phage major capsid protein [Prescottella equi]
MSNARLKSLQEAALAAVKTARDIAEKAQAESREMSDDEAAEYKTAMTRGSELLEQVKAAKRDAEILDQVDSFAKEIGGLEGAGSDAETKRRAKSLGLQVVGSPQFESLMKGFGNRIPDGSRVHSDPIPVKGLFVGGNDSSAGAFVTPEQTGIVEMLGRKELTIRDLISVRRTGSDTVEYVQQTSHTNAAAVVAEATSSAAPTAPEGAGALVTAPGGGYKPEGSWAFERKTAVVKTIAEWVPATKRALADVAALEGLINDELRADIAEAEEGQILNGSGTGENLTGIRNWSGVQTQAFDTDIFTSVRRAITKARKIGRVAPNAVVLSPADMETVDLARDEQGRFFGAGPFAFGPRTLWGLPTIESESQPDGEALLGDYSKAVLWDREQTTVTVTDSHADFFIRNMVAILAEERVAFAVTRPTAFVKVDVAA